MSSELEARIFTDLKAAMREGDEDRKRTLRSLRAAIESAEMEEVRLHRLGRGEPLSEERLLGVLQQQAKQRRDSIEQFTRGGREDLAAAERIELAIIQDYLPRQLSAEEIEQAVREQIAATGASGPSDMGKVMGPLMQRLGSRADGKLVSATVRRLLAD